MTAIAATRRTVKELVDGTLRVTVDVEPMHKAAFLLAFPEVDAPIALAPLNYGGNDDEMPVSSTPNLDRSIAFNKTLGSVKGGPHSQDAARICKDEEFQKFMGTKYNGVTDEATVAVAVRKYCQVDSRAELDHNQEALQRFHKLMREFNEWRERAA